MVGGKLWAQNQWRQLTNDLPIKLVSLWAISFDDYTYEEAAEILTKTKPVDYFEIDKDWNGHEMTPKDLALFKRYPVKQIETGALYIRNDEDLLEFRKVMMEMKIEKIIQNHYWRKKIELPIISHGPGNIYKSI